MTKEQEKILDKALKEQLQAQFTRGLSDGCKATCGVILEKATDTTIGDDKAKLDEIIKFCKISLALK